MNQRARPTKVIKIRDGIAGTRDTLAIMRAMVLRGKKSPLIRETALQLVENFDQKDFAREVRAIHAFVRDQVRYVKDTRGVETVHFPWVLLDTMQGDCDDKAILAASLLESIGHPTRIVAIGNRANQCSHVLLETLIGRKWVSVETTEPVELGWYPDNIKTRIVAHV